MSDRRRLWKAAIKWRMYSVAVMPVLLAAGWRLGGQGVGALVPVLRLFARGGAASSLGKPQQ